MLVMMVMMAMMMMMMMMVSPPQAAELSGLVLDLISLRLPLAMVAVKFPSTGSMMPLSTGKQACKVGAGLPRRPPAALGAGGLDSGGPAPCTLHQGRDRAASQGPAGQGCLYLGPCSGKG